MQTRGPAQLRCSHTPEEFEALSYHGKATARHHAIKYAEVIFAEAHFRAEDIATLLDRQELLERV
eukprot:2714316-Pleurochrysis_carterae.AAC.1